MKSSRKCCVSTLVTTGFPRTPSREILGWFVLEPRGDGYFLRDFVVEKEISSLGLCRLMGKRVR